MTAAAVVAFAGVGVFGAGSAAADPAVSALRYTCSISKEEQRRGEVRIDADVPASAVVGEATPKFVIHATVPVSAADASELRKALVTEISGTVDVQAKVTAPGTGDTPVSVRFRAARTSVPASGAFVIKATGTAPTRTFDKPGRATIVVGDLKAHVSARMGFVTFKVGLPCSLDPGQNNVVASLDVVGKGGATAGPAPSGTAGASTSGTTGASQGREEGGTKPDTAGEKPSGSSGAMAETGSRGTGTLIPLAVGTAALGAVACAAVALFRFRSRSR
ncbi:DUF6801 domain-containing protein [Streptomyces sp. NPDC052095]|uniref:DUF6801 domain-containing protein n=1 Tax=unclassified Streptomyces TaxID=2593676 RepID=UPI00344E070A